MNTRTVRLNRLSAAACATLITVVSAWAFLSSTASMAREELVRGARPTEEVRDYRRPDLLAPPPLCLTGCA
jgi:hypothetical protein